MNLEIRPAIGKPVERVDGRLKVTGGARYAAEFKATNMAHAVLVMSTIASGRISSIDTKAALSAPGVLAVITHENAPRLNFPERPQANDDFVAPVFGRSFPVLQTSTIYFNSQPIAVVVAENLEQAEYAATLVRVDYEESQHVTSVEDEMARAFPSQDGLRKEPMMGRFADLVRGDPEALSKAEVVIDETYTIPIEHHNPMELLSTIAEWSGNKLTLHDKTQWVFNTQRHVALVFGINEEDVHVICPFVGGGFGSSLRPWSHPTVAAMAARVVRRPVKLVVQRSQMFSSHGHRPYTIQRVALGESRWAIDGHRSRGLRTDLALRREHRGARECDAHALREPELHHEVSPRARQHSDATLHARSGRIFVPLCTRQRDGRAGLQAEDRSARTSHSQSRRSRS